MLTDTIHALFKQLDPLIDTESIAHDAQTLSQLEARTDQASFTQAHSWLSQQYQNAGLQTQNIRMQCDGERMIEDYQSPVCWTCTEAKCFLSVDGQEFSLIADRNTIACTAIVGSGHTGPQGVEAELVHVESAQEVTAEHCSGKIILVGKISPMAIRAAAIQAQALGIISYFTDKAELNADHVRWFNCWDAHSDGWLPTEQAAQENFPAISISPALGKEILTLAQQHELRITLIVEGAYTHGEIPSVFAQTKTQSTEQSLIFTAHMFEPGLLDNASGVACALASAKILAHPKLQEQHRRKLLFYHGQECYSVLDLGQKNILPPQIISHLNIDTVGDPNQPMIITDGLPSSDNFSGVLIDYILHQAAAYYNDDQIEHDIFEINCTLLADPLVAGICTRGIGQGKCDSWHTSKDHSQHLSLDAHKLKLGMLTALTWAQLLATADEKLIGDLLDHLVEDFTNKVQGSADSVALLDYYRGLVQSCRLLLDDDQQENAAQRITNALLQLAAREQQHHHVEAADNSSHQAKQMFPKSLVGGPVSRSHFSDSQLKKIGAPKWNSMHVIYKSLADGKTNVRDICRKINAHKPKGRALSIDACIDFFTIYKEAGLISF